MQRQLSIWQEDKNPTVRMHNYLITAKLGFLELSSLRIFLIMIAKLKWDDKDLLPVKINVVDILPSYNGGDHLDLIIKACRELKSKMQDIEILSIENGKRVFERITVIDKVRYVEGTDYIEAHFGRAIKPYLIDLKEHFTTTELKELMDLKSTHAIRLYLIVKSIYRTTRVYSVSLEDLKHMLIGTGQYSEYKVFKRDVLKATQKILQKTTAAFEIEEEKKGKSVYKLHIKPAVPAKSVTVSPFSDELLEMLEQFKVNIKKPSQMLTSGEITEPYIKFVIAAKQKDKTVKKLGGAIHEAIVNKQLWEEFMRQSTTASPVAVQTLLPQIKDQAQYKIISLVEAEKLYESEKSAGTTKWPFGGYVKGLKTGRNILVEGFAY